MSEESTRALYDDLAPDYHLIFEDWSASVDYQSQVLSRLLPRGDELRVLDVACGMGTQSIGIALLGHHVVGRDLSAKLVARGREEAKRRGVPVDFQVGDMRIALPADRGAFDVVIAFDNALPHLESTADLEAALRAGLAALRPDGVFLASVRDYDRAVAERREFDPPRFFSRGENERIVFQHWRWIDASIYEFELFLLQRDGEWTVRTRRGRYRAWRRAELEERARTAGFRELEWIEPKDSGFYQPIFRAQT